MQWTSTAMANELFRSMAKWTRPDIVISGYPEYGTNPDMLDSNQRRDLTCAANMIIRSLSTMHPVRAFLVVGHADKALRKPLNERAAFEQEVSQQRADAGREALLREMVRLAGGPAIRRMVDHAAIGIGNLRPVCANAASEAQMRQNRRIEIVFARALVCPPRCGT